ncbi:MAG: hypothetical protein Q7V57_12785 [Actinomycetota bacterium]|nr:hypothetical protein [Actinomycetota bacterium]
MLHLTRAVAAWGFEFQFASDDAVLAELVEHCYRDLPAATGGRPATLRADRVGAVYDLSIERADLPVEVCSEGRSAPALFELLVWEVNRRARASVADRTVLHAAVFGGAAGAVVLCGSSGSGKSTLSAAAAGRGWRHFSDDLGLVDVEHRTVTPYARPIMLRAGGRQHLGDVLVDDRYRQFFVDEWFVPASALGATTAPGPRALVAVGVLGWGATAGIEPLSRARTLLALTEHSATLADRGAAGFDELARLAQRVPGYSVTLGTTADVLDLLAPLVGAG